jgi:TonB family protein
MRFSNLPAFLICLSSLVAAPTRAQETPAQTASTAPPLSIKLDYPDTPSGLEKLAKDIMKAQKESDTARASALIQSMLLPDPSAWYSQVFGEYSASQVGAAYKASQTNISAQLATYFLNAQQEHATDVVAKKFENKCDDSSGENTFSVLQSRLEPVPLYELRLMLGTQFFRLWALAYVDGGFRFILLPKAADFSSRQKKSPPPASGSAPASEAAKIADEKDSAERVTRVRMGGNVQAAKIINKVQPTYPGTARSEHLQGTVRLHAIIGKDGSVQQLKVISGYCSLAEASMDAVKQWRYFPTTLAGKPVEVDTTIDVIFALNH